MYDFCIYSNRIKAITDQDTERERPNLYVFIGYIVPENGVAFTAGIAPVGTLCVGTNQVNYRAANLNSPLQKKTWNFKKSDFLVVEM